MMETRPRKLLDQVTEAMRLKHDAHKTEQSYVYWINRYIIFHNNRHPA
ncbi:MAG TPA: phage integrase N-terminal SAM-like domain-containing protein [Anaerolineae bacterium]|nr:phage integrase N-terminal SAM-like domain-containing protein [Anaerolineae bacterium]